MNQYRNDTGADFTNILIAFAIGGLVGMLFAPQKGSILRSTVRNKFQDTLDMIDENANKVMDNVEEKAGDIKGKVSSKVGKIKTALEEDSDTNSTY